MRLKRKVKETYQIGDAIEQLIDLLTHQQTNVTFSEHSANLASNLVLANTHHDHKSDEIVEHDGEKMILLEFEAFALGRAQLTVAFHHLGGALIETDYVTFLGNRVKEHVLPELHLIPERAARVRDDQLEEVCSLFGTTVVVVSCWCLCSARFIS